MRRPAIGLSGERLGPGNLHNSRNQEIGDQEGDAEAKRQLGIYGVGEVEHVKVQ